MLFRSGQGEDVVDDRGRVAMGAGESAQSYGTNIIDSLPEKDRQALTAAAGSVIPREPWINLTSNWLSYA